MTKFYLYEPIDDELYIQRNKNNKLYLCFWSAEHNSIIMKEQFKTLKELKQLLIENLWEWVNELIETNEDNLKDYVSSIINGKSTNEIMKGEF